MGRYAFRERELYDIELIRSLEVNSNKNLHFIIGNGSGNIFSLANDCIAHEENFIVAKNELFQNFLTLGFAYGIHVSILKNTPTRHFIVFKNWP